MNCKFLICGMLHAEFNSDKPVLRIRIRIRNQMFSGLPDPHQLFINFGSRSGFGSFHHQEKIVRKTLTPTVLLLLYDFIMEQ
jgi:hypothetical protein